MTRSPDLGLSGFHKFVLVRHALADQRYSSCEGRKGDMKKMLDDWFATKREIVYWYDIGTQISRKIGKPCTYLTSNVTYFNWNTFYYCMKFGEFFPRFKKLLHICRLTYKKIWTKIVNSYSRLVIRKKCGSLWRRSTKHSTSLRHWFKRVMISVILLM